jgi:hypothetical protein
MPDGTYSDNSGAATALALYESLKSEAGQHNVDLRLILLTSAILQPNFSDLQGTPFGDALGPIEAVLQVREGLGTEAVARACDYFFPPNSIPEKDNPCKVRSFVAADLLQVVKIEDQTYGLPLGWKLSHTTFDIISWMLGRATKCQGSSPSAGPETAGTSQLNQTTVQRNSCVEHNIISLPGITTQN